MAEEVSALPRDFSHVVLTLDNVLIDDEKLKVSPSMIDGLNKEDEKDLRILGCDLIQTAGILLKMPQTAMATGQVIFHRFYYSKSFVKHNYEILAMAAVSCASKMEECPRRLRDVLNVFHHIKQVRSKRAIKPLVLDGQYIHMKNQVIKAERRLLKELGFCVHVKHPHKIIVSYLQILDLVENRNVIQHAWNLMNDSLRTDVFVRHTPEAIACACVHLATRTLKIPLPMRPPWYALFGMDLETIESICKMMLHLYSRPKPDQERLEKVCEELKMAQQEQKRKIKVGTHSLDGTPNSASRTNSPKAAASPPVMPVKKIKVEEESRVLENGSSEEKNGQKGKRRLDDSEGSPSPSGSHSRSRSSRSHSRSLSPPTKKKKRSYSPSRRHKKERYYEDYDDYYYREKRSSHKRKKHARSRSLSQSPARYMSSKVSKKYKEYKEKRRSYSPVEKSHRSRKHRNGQRDLSPRYDKYRR